MSCYPYESGEIGDLTFGANEYISVIKKDGDWWTGTIGTRTGIFPSNYVQEIGAASDTYSTDPSANTTGNMTAYELSLKQSIGSTTAPQNYSDDVQNQEEADTEVSEINTQSKSSENVQDTYSRPMSTSSTTSVSQKWFSYILKKRNWIECILLRQGLRGGKKGEVAQVIAPYEATSNEQLSLHRGQLIMIRKKTDSGWWEGELQARGKRRQIGWFPATYVKLLTSGRLSGRSTPVSGGKIQMSETILGKYK